MTLGPDCLPAATSDPVRVMHLVYRLGVGGQEVGIVKLANGLPRASVTTSICSSRTIDNLKLALDEDIQLFELHRRPGNDLGFVRRLVRLLRHTRPDVLHTHGWGTLCEGLLAARIAGVPVVVHGEHGTMETRAINRIVQRYAWSRCNQVLSVSQRLAERMAETVRFPLHRIRTIRNGVDQARFAAASRARGREVLGVSESMSVVGTVGRLVPVKGHEVFLQALSSLARSGRGFLAVVVGGGPRQDELLAMTAALGLTAHVRFLGQQDDVADLLAAMDVFVLSSHSEGLSNTILEAMATGLPVVATRVGGADELVQEGQNGLLVPPRDSEALATAVGYLLSRPDLRQEMGRRSQSIVEADFALHRMIQAYEQTYLEVARGRSRPLLHEVHTEA